MAIIAPDLDGILTFMQTIAAKGDANQFPAPEHLAALDMQQRRQAAAGQALQPTAPVASPQAPPTVGQLAVPTPVPRPEIPVEAAPAPAPRSDGTDVEPDEGPTREEREEKPEKEEKKGITGKQISKSLQAAGEVLDKGGTAPTQPPGSAGIPRGGQAVPAGGLDLLIRLLGGASSGNPGELPSLSSLISGR